MSETRYIRLVDEQPTQTRYTGLGNVTRSIEVSMKSKTTRSTPEIRTRSVTFVDVSTCRTLLRGKPGIYEDNLLTETFGFVSDKLFQFIERPVVQFTVEIRPASFLNPDFGQVFECEHGIRELNDMLRDTVVGISHKPSFSTRHLPEFPDSGSSAFGLEFGSEVCVFATDVLHSRRIEKCVIGTYRNVDNTPVDSENRFVGDNVRSIRFKMTMQIKCIVVLAKGQCRRFDLPCQITPVVFRNAERGFDPTIGCRNRCISGVEVNPNHPGIVSHCRIIFTERFGLTFDCFKRFARTIPCTLHERGREIRNRLTNSPIGCVVAVNLADRPGFKTPGRTDVERHGVISHGFPERLFAIRRNIKFQLDCPNHNHIFNPVEQILCGGGILLTAKAVGFLPLGS